ncbi:MAG: PilC/PilY family type IV pilus protein [Methylotenera sp.]
MNNINKKTSQDKNIYQSKKELGYVLRQYTAIVFSVFGLAAGLLVLQTAFAASPDLAEKPLTVSGGVVKPNLMFVMDTSKSMEKSYANDTLDDAAQCKDATKNKNGHVINGITIGPTANKPTNPNTKLTFSTPNHSSYAANNIVYLTVPGRPTLSGVYKIQLKNNTGTGCTAYNTAVIVNPPEKRNEDDFEIRLPQKIGQTNYSAGNPLSDPPVQPSNGCKVNATLTNSGSTTTDINSQYGSSFVENSTGITAIPSGSCYWRDLKDINGCKVTTAAPANSGSTTNNYNLGGGFVEGPSGITATSSTACYWYDPLDNPINTVCTSSSTTGENSFEINIAAGETPGALTATELADAYILSRQDDSKCYSEPPQRAARVQTLSYDPSVSYRPPPLPKKVGQGLQGPKEEDLHRLNTPGTPHNLLPNMDRTHTTNWRFVRLDGTQLNASGDPNSGYWGGATGSTAIVALSSASNGMGFNRWEEMVYCDTPNRPTGFTNDRTWMDSNRCVQNAAVPNTALKSPNYPYQYPARVGGGTTPSKTLLVTASAEHQNGQSVGSKNPVFDFAGDRYYAFGEYYKFAYPHYYNITPIEYCTNSKLNDCQLGASSGAYTVPAYVRYCKTAAKAYDMSTSPGASDCQGMYTGKTASDYRFARYGLFEKVEIRPDVTSYPKGSNRKDCAGATCTYDEEMTNIANWFAYYRTRMQLMKSASGRTFDTLNADNDADSDYRVGFITVEGYNTTGNYLPINDFNGGVNAQKEKWFKTVYGRVPAGGTSLRDVLGTVGRIYAGESPVTGFSSDDPVQYSCQQNFTLLTTDGYWNGDAGLKVDGSGSVGNQDASPTPLPYREGPAVSDTLADVAMYYYGTDLRDTTLGNCTGALGSDVCLNDVLESGDDNNKKQHMTTFTLGLGVDGFLNYSPTYKTDSSGDFYNLKNGLAGVQWPLPGADNGDATYTAAERATVDDLWHAAVNGRGTYFSAKNPDELIAGITGTLLALGDAPGTGSATALSNVTPVAGDNYAYSARFTTGTWSGNLFARTIDAYGTLSANALWCVENESSVTPACAGVFNSQVAANTDTRNIYFNDAGTLKDFTFGNLGAAGKSSYFDQAYLSTRLHQWLDGEYTVYQKTKVGGDAFVNYLSGQFGFDKRAANDLGAGVDNRIYRERGAVLGDIVESDPVFVGKPKYEYTDAGYSTFISDNTARPRTIYVGANDGMLHAFDADPLTGGTERWAFVPTVVMPNLWKLADKNYRNMHTNYVNAEMSVGDVFINGQWETILVSGLGQGGRGYFALNITDPLAPKLLWEFDSSTEANLGYSYGKPLITKRADGKWVVAVTSGYNNTSPGNGTGHLFVLDAADGNVLSDISNGVGSVATPSGLAQIAGFANNPVKNNTSDYVYGGDLLGNLWRFDMMTNTATLITTLVDGIGNTQPITVIPTLGEAEGKRVIYVGTGKFIEPEDLLPVNYKQQTLYALKDDNLSSAVVGIRSQMVEQTLSTAGITRESSSYGVDWGSKLGWFVDLDSGERQNVKATLISGVLFVPTIVPPSGLCDLNGKGWLNVFDYKTGGAVDATVSTVVSTQVSSPIAGLYFTFPLPLPGETGPGFVTSGIDRANADNNNRDDGGGGGANLKPTGGFVGNRAIWRELVP